MTKTVMVKSGVNGRLRVRSISGLLSLLGAGALLLFPVAAMAQTADSLQQSGNSDVDSTFGDSDGLNMFEMMHRAQQGQIRTSSEFSQDQQQSISNEAADFRTRQQEAYQQQHPGTVYPGVTPGVTNPAPTTPAPGN